MKNKNLIRLLVPAVVLPIIIVVLMFLGNLTGLGTYTYIAPPQVVSLQKDIEKLGGFLVLPSLGELVFNSTSDREALLKEQILEAKARAVDTYFKEYNMPLEGTGMKMVQEAEKNGLDWRLLPAIAVIESTGGKFACKSTTHSFFGWGSCKIGFKSKEHAIEVVAWNLGGNNPNTVNHYAGKTTKEILQKYNPPYVVPNYAKKVMQVMNDIGDENLTPPTLLSVNM